MHSMCLGGITRKTTSGVEVISLPELTVLVKFQSEMRDRLGIIPYCPLEKRWGVVK